MGRRAKINTRKRNRRIILILVVAVVVGAGVVFAIFIENSLNPPCTYCSSLYKPIPTLLYQQVTGVSDSTLSAVSGPSSVATPSPISGSLLTLNGKPEVIYIGGEYCPFCAVERWSLIMAMSKFGTFSGIQYMVSSSTDANPNTPTFTFQNASYSSQYIAFVSVEEFNRSNPGAIWHQPTTAEAALVTQYGTGGIPFIDFANQYVINGVQTTIDLSGQNWTQVASQLDTSSNPTAIAIDGSANKLISAICKMDGGVPASVCNQTYATIPLSYAQPGSSTASLAVFSIFSVNPMGEKTRWTN